MTDAISSPEIDQDVDSKHGSDAEVKDSDASSAAQGQDVEVVGAQENAAEGPDMQNGSAEDAAGRGGDSEETVDVVSPKATDDAASTEDTDGSASVEEPAEAADGGDCPASGAEK